MIGLDDTRVHVSVTNTANIETLKHKLQNATGIHISEIIHSHKDKIISKQSNTVGFYSGSCARSKELLRMVQVKKESPTIGSNIDVDGELIMRSLHVYML